MKSSIHSFGSLQMNVTVRLHLAAARPRISLAFPALSNLNRALFSTSYLHDDYTKHIVHMSGVLLHSSVPHASQPKPHSERPPDGCQEAACRRPLTRALIHSTRNIFTLIHIVDCRQDNSSYEVHMKSIEDSNRRHTTCSLPLALTGLDA